MNINDQFDVFSEHTLWIIDEDLEPRRVQNNYNNLEIIRVRFPDGSYNDYPIENDITFVPPLANFFFKKEEDAARFSKIIDDEEGMEIVLDNAAYSSRKSEFNECFKGNLKTGIYCIPYYDREIPDWSWLREIRWLNSENLIKKPIEVQEKDKNLFVRYMTMHNVDNVYINDRILFEVINENNNIYINHFVIHNSSESYNPIYFTRNYQFPIFCGKEYAWYYRDNLEHGGKITDFIRHEQQRIGYCKSLERKREINKELIKNIVKAVGEFAWNNCSGKLLEIVKGKLAKAVEKKK